MLIVLANLDGSEIARAPIITDAHGYLYVYPLSHQFEFSCALYGYQEGREDCGFFTDDDGERCAQWRVEV